MTLKPPQSGHSPADQHAPDLPAVAGGVPMRSRQTRIVFGAPLLGEAEVASVADCIRSGWIGMGKRVGRFEREFASYTRAPYAAAVSSCSAALHLALEALGIQPGDEVIAPSLTFCSTVHAVLHVGAIPVLVDSERDSLNIDPDVIAHAIETTYRGVSAGLLGDAGCFSFYPTKSITTGDGGMVISRHRELIERVKLMSYNGVATTAWTRFAGDAAGYEVLAAGYKYNMTDMEAALALPQLPLLEERWAQRQLRWRTYDERLQGLPITLPATGPSENRHAYHLYTPLLQLEKLSVGRGEIVAAMETENIGVGIHYEPVHIQPFYAERFGRDDARYPNATYIGERTISLPLSAGLTEADVADVCAAFTRILRYYAV